MPLMPLVVDVATAPIPEAADHLGEINAPSNWKDPAKIGEYIAEKTLERLAQAATDLDLARLTAVGLLEPGGEPTVTLCKTEYDERAALTQLGSLLGGWANSRPLITYNGFAFDLPVVMRRARYLGVAFPKLNLDRYRSPHHDLLLELTDRDPSRRRPLGFYVKRLGWTDLSKALSGAEESQVHDTGKWEELAASVRHDLVAAYRLAEWLGITLTGTLQ